MYPKKIFNQNGSMIEIPDLSDLIGIPFSSRGRDPKVSLSCWGLVMVVQRRFGNIIPDYSIPAEATIQIAAAFSLDINQWEQIGIPVPGSVVAIACDANYPRHINHFGVCIGNGFIHTLEKFNSVVTPMDHRFFVKKMKGFYQWKKSV